jgi:hypothetical protein
MKEKIYQKFLHWSPHGGGEEEEEKEGEEEEDLPISGKHVLRSLWKMQVWKL